MANRAATILRSYLSDPSKTLVCPGVQDGLSARVCLEQGFEALYMVQPLLTSLYASGAS